MNKAFTVKCTYIFVLLSLLIGCTKTGETVQPISKSSLLVKKWKYTDIMAIAPGYPLTSIYTSLESCKRDNYWEFKSDATFTVGEGLTKCKPTDPDANSTGTWSLFYNDTKMIMTEVGKPAKNVDILELTSTSLKLIYNDSIQGLPATITAIFVPY